MACKPGAWRIKARKLRDAGMNNGQISRAVGVHLGTVRRFFDMDLGDNTIRMTGGYATWTDSVFIEPHVYRTPKKLDMGPIVTAALEAVYERRWRRVGPKEEQP